MLPLIRPSGTFSPRTGRRALTIRSWAARHVQLMNRVVAVDVLRRNDQRRFWVGLKEQVG
jgi:hypothetical protein